MVTLTGRSLGGSEKNRLDSLKQARRNNEVIHSGILGIGIKTFGIQIHFCQNHCDRYRCFLNLSFI